MDQTPPPSPEAPPRAPHAGRPADVAPPGSAPPLTRIERPGRPPAAPGVEEGGPAGPEPTRYNDWERKGRVSDF